MRSRWSAHAGFWSAAAAFTVVAASASSFPGLSFARSATGRQSADAVSAAALRDADGSGLRFDERNGVVYVVDPLTGQRATFGNDLLAVGVTKLGDGRSVMVAFSNGVAYAIDQRRGLVQPLDPDTLQPTGKATRLGRGLSNPVVDSNQTLWVASSDSGWVYGLAGTTHLRIVDQGHIAVGGQPLMMGVSSSGVVTVTNQATGKVVPAATDARRAAQASAAGASGGGELASGAGGSVGRSTGVVVPPGGDGTSPVTAPPTTAPPTTDTVPPPPPPPPTTTTTPPPPPPPTSTPPTTTTQPPAALLDAPTGVQVADNPDGSVDVSWNAVPNAAGYLVQWARRDGTTGERGVDSSPTTLDLTAGTDYSISVATVNTDQVAGGWSAAVDATPYVAEAASFGTPYRKPTGDGALSPHVWVVPVSVPAGSSGPATLTVTSDAGDAVDYPVPDEGGTFAYEVSLDWDATATRQRLGARRGSGRVRHDHHHRHEQPAPARRRIAAADPPRRRRHGAADTGGGADHPGSGAGLRRHRPRPRGRGEVAARARG